MQKEIEKNAHTDASFALRIVRQEEVLKKRELVAQKKVGKLATQVNKNLPNGIQKRCKYY